MSKVKTKAKTVHCAHCGMKVNVLPNMKKFKCKHCGMENSSADNGQRPKPVAIRPPAPAHSENGEAKPPAAKEPPYENDDDFII